MRPATGSRFSCLRTAHLTTDLGQASLAFNLSFGVWQAPYSDKPLALAMGCLTFKGRPTWKFYSYLFLQILQRELP